ncbi:toll-like receptor 3 isoform X1 [Leptidea sinapis]|uniref:toll-like receptor 3 isoform X1 n=1 Tax=Leptidea sinapis TaxID=189913 RepID=UPI002125EFDF|nr:toll-like receptor 3 isoform X1 [Leptidea sinapis]
MVFARYLWLLLYYAQYAGTQLMKDYEDITLSILSPPVDEASLALPFNMGQDRTSGCFCRSTSRKDLVVCFGNYECAKFPKINIGVCDTLVVRTTVISQITVGDLDQYFGLRALKIDGNSRLHTLQPGIFRNLSNLEELSVSYNTQLHYLQTHTFTGLVKLKSLILVNNRFEKLTEIVPAFKPNTLPSLTLLDLSENNFENINENTFLPMNGSKLEILNLNLCRLDYIHPNSFSKLKKLKELHIRENDLNAPSIYNFLLKMIDSGINLGYLDLSGMGFRKQPPMKIMEMIANTTIRRLNLADNQFELITDDDFPYMPNIEVLDLRRVFAIAVSPYAFNPDRFPKLRILLLSGNNLPGINIYHISCQQLLLLDLSSNKGTSSSSLYYEIDRGVFSFCRDLRFLNLAYNRIKHIYNYTFIGLENLRILNMENGTLFHIGLGTFKPMKHLEILNLGNNPLVSSENLTSSQFEGLNELKMLILRNCGIKRFNDDDNMFEMMPNLTHLILTNNQLFYITVETLKPLKFLKVLDLSQNLLVSWWQPIFLASGIQPTKLYLMNNKISHFSLGMIQDLNYLLEKYNASVEIDLMDNLFICDCNSMYKIYTWLQVNGSDILKKYFAKSNILCSSPDVWEDRRVADFMSSIKNLRCFVYQKFSTAMLLVWTAPSLVTIAFLLIVIFLIYRYRIYIRYWLFLAKVALGRSFIRRTLKADNLNKAYKYDAFVSYCNDDREFVLEMISQLESQPPYLKLCIYERDFEIGTFISEAILRSINESRHIILIISNGFAKSQWCRWETHLAEYHRLFLDDGTPHDPLVLIKTGEVENKYLTTTLKYLLKTKIYHSWTEQNSDDFWKKLRNVLVKNK